MLADRYRRRHCRRSCWRRRKLPRPTDVAYIHSPYVRVPFYQWFGLSPSILYTCIASHSSLTDSEQVSNCFVSFRLFFGRKSNNIRADFGLFFFTVPLHNACGSQYRSTCIIKEKSQRLTACDRCETKSTDPVRHPSTICAFLTYGEVRDRVTQAHREIGLMEDRVHERNNKMSYRKWMGGKNSGISFEMNKKRKKNQ